MAKPASEVLRMVVETAFAARMLVSAADDRIVYVNRAAEDTFGYSSDELIDAEVDILLPSRMRALHRELRQAYYRSPSRVLIGLDRDIYAVRKSGAEFPVHIGLAPIQDDNGALFVAVTVFDISHHKEIERQLVERAHELELANERLARFAYVASHDLQEPLRKIAAFAQMMERALERNDRTEAVHATEVLRSSALRARELVNGLLAYSRQVSTPPRLERLLLRGEIEAVVSDFSELIRQTGAQIVNEVAAGVTVDADKAQFERCLSSLLSNAIKYRKPQLTPRIVFSAKDGDELHVSVADNGIGFEPKHAEAIFEPLKRLHSFSQYPGAGVGLALCKATCERHHWRIEAVSQLGAGATFTLSIPHGETAAPRAA
ncbi:MULTISPECIES: sensor histidine kinase [Methylosinus]|uniref:histidine kinase n=1 Tax=Methylosinus trichosporium (strain ATCC 35070 / NCIMB 11131 / UNIQEM 75 / OB3b) TaxID=595536 RepID=A0A2D2D3G2_METT3|nr:MULTISPECIES: ATP-binding protein [Methylosinus]ATQ69540.1 PAS domain-containing sensor histidine kinase [Methylosinus trichosporium OB3b]OBS50499.1 PAS domain-containing sensor histidine kinase [Methylosinus sp. 3S-1]